MNKKKNKKEKELALTLVPAPLKQNQLLAVLQKTPAKHIYRRPAKGGGEWEYVTGTFIKKVLNYIFGWMWDFEVREHGREKAEEGDLVWVLGRLTIKDRSGKPMIVKEQFGRADVKFKRGTKIPLDFGNDLKAAATDSLKKCASELGIASDIYGKNEFMEIQKVDKGFIPPKEKKTSEEIGEEMDIADHRIEDYPPELRKKVNELKTMLKGESDEEKLANLKKKTSIVLKSFNITEKHAGILIASLLNSEVKK